MAQTFAETLKRLRHERHMSQQQLANKLFVDRSSIANWELSRRVPDAILISRIAECLEVEVSELMGALEENDDVLNVILVDDEEILIAGTIPVLTKAMPNASITGFSRVSEAISYAQNNRIAIAFLDIELGRQSGLELCKTLMDINPTTNVIFLTSYPDYAINAWDTQASGFLVKPLKLDDVNEQLEKLRFPIKYRGKVAE